MDLWISTKKYKSNCRKILSLIDNEIDREAIEQSKKFLWRKTAEGMIKVYEEVLQR